MFISELKEGVNNTMLMIFTDDSILDTLTDSTADCEVATGRQIA